MGAGEIQSASPNAGARSTASSNPRLMSLRTCIPYHVYTIADFQARAGRKKLFTLLVGAPNSKSERARQFG